MYNMKNLAKFETFNELLPGHFRKFIEFDKAALEEGAVPSKYKELMAVAVALTTQCPYCIELHCENARKAGASPTELAETAFVAAAIGAGGALAHGTHLLLK